MRRNSSDNLNSPSAFTKYLGGLLTCWLTLFLGVEAEASGKAELVDRVVATVNDSVVLASDMTQFKRRLQKDSFIDEILIPDEDLKKRALENEETLLQILIDERVLDDEVKRENLQATSEQVEQRIRSITQQNRISLNDLKQALSQQGSSFSEYQSFIRSQLERQNLIGKQVRSKIQVSDEEIANAYMKARRAGKKESFEYRISHILFLINGPRDEERAQQKAAEVQNKLKDGKSFESVAQEYSEDPRFTAGGILGDFKSGEISKEFEEALRDLEVGGVSKPVKSRSGLHLLKLTGRKLIPDPQFLAEKERLRAQLTELAYKRQFKFWLDQRRAEAVIRINKPA